MESNKRIERTGALKFCSIYFLESKRLHACFSRKYLQRPKCSCLDVLEAPHKRELKAKEAYVTTSSNRRQTRKTNIVLVFVVLDLTQATQVLYDQHENWGIWAQWSPSWLSPGVWMLFAHNHTKFLLNDSSWVLVMYIWRMNFLDHGPQSELLKGVLDFGELKTKKEGRSPFQQECYQKIGYCLGC